MSNDQHPSEHDQGFTLIEIVIAIVLVGVLSAVAVVGVGQLTDKASSASCTASADAARAAVAPYLATHGAYPSTFTQLTASGSGSPAALELPSSVAVAAQSLSTSGWTLTMTPASPPTFACITDGPPASLARAATAATTTTSAPVDNGVVAVGVATGDQRYFGEHTLTLTNTAPVTALSVTIDVVQTDGLTYTGQYTTFWSSTVANAHATSAGVVSFTFTLDANQTIVPGTWTIAGQTSGTGTVHPTSGDAWTITSTSGGVTNTVSGTF
jgi:prepilin-type N-terminal cleavage/methylation domain-containing protein